MSTPDRNLRARILNDALAGGTTLDREDVQRSANALTFERVADPESLARAITRISHQRRRASEPLNSEIPPACISHPHSPVPKAAATLRSLPPPCFPQTARSPGKCSLANRVTRDRSFPRWRCQAFAARRWAVAARTPRTCVCPAQAHRRHPTGRRERSERAPNQPDPLWRCPQQDLPPIAWMTNATNQAIVLQTIRHPRHRAGAQTRQPPRLHRSHVALEIECVDWLPLDAHVPNLQVSGQVARFL
jgi:hypothetical protein